MGMPMTVTVKVKCAGTMYLVLLCWLLYLSITPQSVTAAHLDIYPADEVIERRIQNVLRELRQKQLRILQNTQEYEVPPQFTFHFPEDPNPSYQNGYFAVPPSDPRYYNPDADLLAGEMKRLEDDGNTYQRSVSDPKTGPQFGFQVGSPKTTEEGSWTEEVTTESTEQPVQKKSDDISYVFKKILPNNDQDIIFVAIIAGCGAAAAAGVIALSYGWYRLHSNSKAAADIEYPAYGVTGPNKEITPTGDRRLAHSAQMYHYQHQKQQIIAMESNRANNERRGSVSEGDSDEENEEGDYTVYECPGLAATGELEVKNPLFLDDPTPAAGNHTTEEIANPAEKK